MFKFNFNKSAISKILQHFTVKFDVIKNFKMILIKGSENKAGDGSIKMKPSNTPTHVRVISNLSY